MEVIPREMLYSSRVKGRHRHRDRGLLLRGCSPTCTAPTREVPPFLRWVGFDPPLLSYAKFYDLELETPSFPHCVQGIVDRFAILERYDRKVSKSLSSKLRTRELRDFARFLRFLDESFVSTPGELASMFSMSQFLKNKQKRNLHVK